MKRITVKRGTTKRTFTVVAEPYPKVGDVVTIKGEGAEWTVHKCVDTEGFSITFPAKRKTKERPNAR